MEKGERETESRTLLLPSDAGTAFVVLVKRLLVSVPENVPTISVYEVSLGARPPPS